MLSHIRIIPTVTIIQMKVYKHLISKHNKLKEAMELFVKAVFGYNSCFHS